MFGQGSASQIPPSGCPSSCRGGTILDGELGFFQALPPHEPEKAGYYSGSNARQLAASIRNCWMGGFSVLDERGSMVYTLTPELRKRWGSLSGRDLCVA